MADWYSQVRGLYEKREYRAIPKADTPRHVHGGSILVYIDEYANDTGSDYAVEFVECITGWGQYVRSIHSSKRGMEQRIANQLKRLGDKYTIERVR